MTSKIYASDFTFLLDLDLSISDPGAAEGITVDGVRAFLGAHNWSRVRGCVDPEWLYCREPRAFVAELWKRSGAGWPGNIDEFWKRLVAIQQSRPGGEDAKPAGTSRWSPRTRCR